MRIGTLLVLSTASIAGCTVGPDYQRPEVQSPATWRMDYSAAADVANSPWWEQFGDPVLNALVETSLRENLDVRIAAARVDQFVGNLSSVRSQFYPQVGYGIDASRNRASSVGLLPLPPGTDPYFSLYQASLGASWQVDLFGRVARESEAAQAQVFASQQAQRGVVLSLVSSITSSYIALRALDRQLEIAQATADNFAATARLFELQFNAGIAAKTEVVQIRSQQRQAEAAIPAFEQGIAVLENLISLLLGKDSGPIERGKTIDQLIAPQIPADLPAALLERRPDILQAEQNLIAANANVGATRALYYPSFSITGLLGSASRELDDFLTGNASTGLIAAGVTGPIFTFGGIEGLVTSAEAQSRQAELFYRQTILNAFRETNNALSGSVNKNEQMQLQRERVEALREFARLARLRFDKGIASYLEVLVADNELFAAELQLVGLQAERYTQLINVYQSVGGGWVDIATAMAPAPLELQ